jgi:hypothetical protein
MIGAWEPAVTIVVAVSHNVTSAATLVGATLAAVGVLATAVWGFLLAGQRLWWQLLVSAPVGAGVLLFWYVVAMVVLASPGDDTADTAAGAGVVILSMPTIAVVSLGLGLGIATRLMAHTALRTLGARASSGGDLS